MIAWAKKEEDFVIKEINSGTNPKDLIDIIKKKFNTERTYDSIKNLYRRRTSNNISDVAPAVASVGLFDGSLPVKELYPQLESMKAREEIYKKFASSDHKILIMSDIEIPFHNPDYIKKAIKFAIEEGCTDLCIGGDFFHEYALSKYAKDKNITMDDEYEIGQDFANIVKNKFDNVVFIMGNHDFRIMSWLRYTMSDKFSGVKCILDNDRGDILEKLCRTNGFLYSKDWFCQMGELIVSHQFPYSSVWGRNPTSAVDWFLARMPKGMDYKWDDEDSLRIRPFRALSQGHSHRVFSGGIYKKVLMYETGCMCKEIDFNVRGNRSQPVWERGFGILTLENGRIQYNKSRVYLCKEI